MRQGKFKRNFTCSHPMSVISLLLRSKDIIMTIKAQAFTTHTKDHENYTSTTTAPGMGLSLVCSVRARMKGKCFSLFFSFFTLFFPLSSLSVETCGQLLCFHVVRWSKAERDSNCPPLKRSSAWDQGPSRWGDSHENGRRSWRNARGPAWQK